MWQKSRTHLNLGSISAKRRHEIKFNEIHRNDFYEKDTVVLDILKRGLKWLEKTPLALREKFAQGILFL